MTQTFKVLSVLLSYPSAEVKAACPELRAALEHEKLLAEAPREGLALLIDEYESRDLLDLQERYVLLFDRTRSLSLHLFEHVHGESRDRGQAMVDLQALYAENALAVDSQELPDYLPLFLEFLATLPLQQALELLSEPAHVLTALTERLRKRDSIYVVVFEALCALLSAPADEATTQSLLNEADDDPNDLDALDAVWESEPVRFGPETNGEIHTQGLGMPTMPQRGAKDE